MRTSKPFSTISYNTPDFLTVKLNDLIRQGVIDFWVYVEHLPEDDETKAHKHLYCVPSRLIDTAQFVTFLQEVDANKPLEKPLGVIMPVGSKFGDWFLYAQHDVAYLMSKGQSRKFGYDLKDFKTSDTDYFNEIRHRIDLSKSNTHKKLVDAVQSKTPFQELVVTGLIPINQIHAYEMAYKYITDAITFRNGRTTHVDKDTGEIIEV